MLRGSEMSSSLFPKHLPNYVWEVLGLTFKRFFSISGTQWAGAFAFNAFFSLFPLTILLVTIASVFVDRNIAGKEIISYIESYFRTGGEIERHVFDTLSGVINMRKQAGTVAFLILVWTASQSFLTLIFAINCAWGVKTYNWWRLPLKGMLLLGITACAVLFGMVAPVLVNIANNFSSWFYAFGSFFITLLVVFLFYWVAPL